MAYVVTWIPWLCGLWGSQNRSLYVSLFNLVGLLGPLAVALVLILSSGSEALKSDFRDRLFNLRRIRPLYLIVAVVMPPTVMCLSIWLSLWFGHPPISSGFPPAPTCRPDHPAVILAPIIEEMGWRGYGVDSLRAKSGMTKATLLFGALWSVWHAPLALIGGTYQNQLAAMDNGAFLANFFISIIPAAIIANWLYYKNNRSIGAAILLHAMLNAASVLLNAGQVAKCIATVLYAAIAAGIFAIDRAAFVEGPRNFLRAAAKQ